MNDQDLLRQYVQQKRQDAFTELARRHLDFVYGTARRLVNGDGHRAEDIAQRVFVDLARKAPKLIAHPGLTGWLYASTRFVALATIRSEQRRSAREQEAEIMNETPSPDWQKIRPVIDDALQELNERDREFVLRRYFEQQPLGAIAQQFEVSENAAQKAVSRSLDLLNAALSRRGITSTAVALGIVLGSGTVAAPATLLSSISAAVGASTMAVAGAAGVGSGMAGGVAAGGVMVALKWAAALVVVGALAGTAGYWRGDQRAAAADAAEARQREAEATARIRALEAQVRQESGRAALAEADLGKLLRAVDQARAERQAAAMAAAQILPGVVPTPAAKGTVYTVQPGDTAAKIAHAYGLATKDVAEANAGVNFARLRVGQIITLPPGAALVDPTKAAAGPAAAEYQVKPGDTAARIVSQTGVGLAELRQLNPGIDWTALAEGQQIRLK